MTRPEEDDALAKIWRGAHADAPDHMLDARIMAAARAQRRRHFLAPLGALLAACLLLAFFLAQPAPKQVTLDTSTFGLYEGRAAALLADPQAMRQIAVRNQPGGFNFNSNYGEVIYP